MSIRLKSIIFLGIVLSVAFSLSNTGYAVRVRALIDQTSSTYGDALRQATLENARNIFISLEEGTEDSLERGEMLLFDGLLHKMGKIDGVLEIGLTDPEGKVVYSDDENMLGRTLEPQLFSILVGASGELVQEMGGKEVLFGRSHLLDGDCLRCHIDNRPGDLSGVLFVRYDLSNLQQTEEAMAQMTASNLDASVMAGIMTGVAGLIFAVGGIYFLLGRIVSRPLTTVVGNLREIAQGEGDLTKKLEIHSKDEVGALGENFNLFVERQRLMVSSVRDVASGILQATEVLGDATREVSDETLHQSQALHESQQALNGILEDISGIAQSTGSLVESSQESTSATMELGATIEEINDQVARLFSTVEEVAASIHQMTSTSTQINRNVRQLNEASRHSAAAIIALDTRIGDIEKGAENTGVLAEQASADAAQGMTAVQESIRGMESLHGVVSQASDVILHLGEQSDAIGNILEVIDDVAVKTNLLALNASIIAASAGEHGEAFNVVALEIRDLASRTAASTGEIARIIKGFQHASQEASEVMTRGRQHAEEEVRRAHQTGEALQQIHSSTEKARKRVHEIVVATHEQTEGSQQITASVQQISAMLSEIGEAIGHLDSGIGQTSRASEQMQLIARRVKSSSDEQAEGSRHIAGNMETMRAMIARIDEATQDQSRRSEEAVAAVRSIHAIAEGTARRTEELDRVVESLLQQAESLNGEVGAFKT